MLCVDLDRNRLDFLLDKVAYCRLQHFMILAQFEIHLYPPPEVDFICR